MWRTRLCARVLTDVLSGSVQKEHSWALVPRTPPPLSSLTSKGGKGKRAWQDHLLPDGHQARKASWGWYPGSGGAGLVIKPKPELGHLLTQVRVHLYKPILMSSRKIFLVLSLDKGRVPLLKLVPCPSLTVFTLRTCAPACRSGPLVFASALSPTCVCPHAH